MSGDINTGMGNCLIMCSIVLSYLEHRGIDARLANNGDDCVLVLERSQLHRLDRISDWFSDFGFKLTREDPVDVFERVVFCQAQPVMVGGQYRMVRDPWTAMSKDCVSLLSWDGPEQFAVWRDAIGICGLELTRGVPVWESYYRSIAGSGRNKGGVAAVYDTGMGYMARGVRDAQVDSEARYSFWAAFGIDPDLQVAMENSWPGVAWAEPPLVKTNLIQKINVTNPLCLLSATRRQSEL